MRTVPGITISTMAMKHAAPYQASDPASTSSLTNASRHDCKDVLDGPFKEGMGRERYMKELYVVDVCETIRIVKR
jgi:hypothetical protein